MLLTPSIVLELLRKPPFFEEFSKNANCICTKTKKPKVVNNRWIYLRKPPKKKKTYLRIRTGLFGDPSIHPPGKSNQDQDPKESRGLPAKRGRVALSFGIKFGLSSFVSVFTSLLFGKQKETTFLSSAVLRHPKIEKFGVWTSKYSKTMGSPVDPF